MGASSSGCGAMKLTSFSMTWYLRGTAGRPLARSAHEPRRRAGSLAQSAATRSARLILRPLLALRSTTFRCFFRGATDAPWSPPSAPTSRNSCAKPEERWCQVRPSPQPSPARWITDKATGSAARAP